jgi:hypothetical protein
MLNYLVEEEGDEYSLLQLWGKDKDPHPDPKGLTCDKCPQWWLS